MDVKLRTIVPLVACLALGCLQSVPSEPTADQRRPETSGTVSQRPTASQTETSFDTPRDGRFAEFVQQTAGTMLRKLAVGIERRGTMRVQLSEAVSPEDTLPLTRSLMTGAQKDFPDKSIMLAVFDPHGKAILKAHYEPGDGVRYEVAQGGRMGDASKPADRTTGSAPGSAAPRTGATNRDQRFADWAMETAPKYLRYVEADLEKRGRLWFGVTRAVAPQEVRDLTASLLKGARTEFPQRELTATVFDPDGEKIGRATLSADGNVRWVP